MNRFCMGWYGSLLIAWIQPGNYELPEMGGLPSDCNKLVVPNPVS